MVRSQTYEIAFAGQAGATTRAEFDDCQVIVGPSTTVLRAELPDQAALAGLVQRITGLGLEVVHLNLMASSPEQDAGQALTRYPCSGHCGVSRPLPGQGHAPGGRHDLA